MNQIEAIITKNKSFKNLKTTGVDLTIYKPKTQVIIKQSPLWQNLIEQNIFEENKALSTCSNLVADFENLDIYKVEEVFDKEYPPLSTIKKYQGEDMTKKLICAIITHLEESFNLKHELTGVHLKRLSRLVLKEYYFLNIADFHVFIDNVSFGKYGNIYNKLDVITILQLLSKYVEERHETAFEKNHNKSSTDKNKHLEIHPDIIKKLSTTIDKMNQKALDECKPEITKKDTYNEDSITVILPQYAMQNWKTQKQFIPFGEYYNQWYQKLTETLNCESNPSSEKIISIIKNLKLDKNT